MIIIRQTNKPIAWLWNQAALMSGKVKASRASEFFLWAEVQRAASLRDRLFAHRGARIVLEAGHSCGSILPAVVLTFVIKTAPLCCWHWEKHLHKWRTPLLSLPRPLIAKCASSAARWEELSNMQPIRNIEKVILPLKNSKNIRTVKCFAISHWKGKKSLTSMNFPGSFYSFHSFVLFILTNAFINFLQHEAILNKFTPLFVHKKWGFYYCVCM